MEFLNADARSLMRSQGMARSLDELPDCAGVYAFFPRRGKVRYVGMAGGERLREEAMRSLNQRRKGEPDDVIWWAETESGYHAAVLERLLIRRHNPPRNGVELVPRTSRVWDAVDFLLVVLLALAVTIAGIRVLPDLLALLFPG